MFSEKLSHGIMPAHMISMATPGADNQIRISGSVDQYGIVVRSDRTDIFHQLLRVRGPIGEDVNDFNGRESHVHSAAMAPFDGRVVVSGVCSRWVQHDKGHGASVSPSSPKPITVFITRAEIRARLSEILSFHRPRERVCRLSLLSIFRVYSSHCEIAGT